MPSEPPSDLAIPLTRQHLRRLREVYRSAGWPSQDTLEIELLASGLLARVTANTGHESLRVTDAGLRQLAQTRAVNRALLSAHEALVERVALEMGRAGRLVWRGLALRAQVPAADAWSADAPQSATLLLDPSRTIEVPPTVTPRPSKAGKKNRNRNRQFSELGHWRSLARGRAHRAASFQPAHGRHFRIFEGLNCYINTSKLYI